MVNLPKIFLPFVEKKEEVDSAMENGDVFASEDENIDEVLLDAKATDEVVGGGVILVSVRYGLLEIIDGNSWFWLIENYPVVIIIPKPVKT